ncbi:cral trio domain containing protein [Niveomyces insectorum RCEF 264]|uniref:Cral trio domain containing protein n=1 Tax=Niveomyces insectorum RCEF 264 TaxID=1081102 RepID=A0A167SI93_9HYPO|nr:cral trio domain containing protein [Niveomyces insectorum RCEF 264]
MRCLSLLFRSTTYSIAARAHCGRIPSLAGSVHRRRLSWTSAFSGKGSPTPPYYRTTPAFRVLEASSGVFGLVAAASLTVGAALYYHLIHRPPSTAADDAVVQDLLGQGQFFSENAASEIVKEAVVQMALEIQPGRLGNLTPEQEEKLRQLWVAIFRVCNVDTAAAATNDGADDADGTDEEDDATAERTESVTSAVPGDGKKKDKKKRRNLFKRSKKKDAGAANDSAAATSKTKAASPSNNAAAAGASSGEDDKYGQGKVFQDALASQSPESIRATIWTMVKHDHPDALVLRFLRARKWDVDKALVMLVSTMHWRSQDMHVDDDIMQKGESGAAEAATTSTDVQAKTVGKDFLAQLRMGKSFLHGVDKAGRPICVVRVRLHHQGDQVEESLERYTVYIIETARMALRPPADTATIIFDMTNFSLANMDYSPVKFMIKCFEANYPECLGAVLVHKAPWLFQNPVVASKVHFTNNVKDMEQFIDRDKIIKELDGDENWEYRYVEPEPGENNAMRDTATRDKLLAEREQLYRAFEAATARWVHTQDGEKAQAIKTQRDEIAQQLNSGYWTLDPYVRARSLYDRVGMLQPGGTVNFYPVIEKDEATQTNGNAAAQAVLQTSADDVD